MGVFKSYDIRGVYPNELDETFAKKLGVALGRHFTELKGAAPKIVGGRDMRAKPTFRGAKGDYAAPRIVVGRDMRASAPTMAAALIAGLTAAGCDVLDIGMVTTPCCYFAIQRLTADGGVMCTASHNPPQYIGFKVSRELAIPISFDSGLGAVQSALDEPAPAVAPGRHESVDVDDAYLDFLAGMARNLKPLRVAADASNGMAGKYLARLFDKLSGELHGIYLEPDGSFPNHDADPLKPENLHDVSRLVRESRSQIGFCFDGDGDRVAVVDEQGEPVGCDLITALLAKDALAEQPGKPITYDLRSSKIVPEVIKQSGGEAVRIRVGHAHAKQLMRKIGAVAGGELSGHYYFELRDRATFYVDSALVACVRLLNIVSASGKPVSELLAPLRKYHHSGELNFSIDDKDGALAAIRSSFADGKQDELDGVTVAYPNWWFNVRLSNTEPLLRLTLEGDSAALRATGLERVIGVLCRFGEPATSAH